MPNSEPILGKSDPIMRKVVSKCRLCGKVDEFEVPDSGLQARAKGKPLVDAFPDLHDARIRQLSDHVCPACQAKEVA